MNQLSVATVEAVAKLWNAGASIDDIIQKTGRTRSSIEGLRKNHSGLFENRYRRSDEERLSAIAKLWRAGKTRQQIADELGLTVRFVRGLIGRHRERFPLRKNRADGLRVAAEISRKLGRPPVEAIAAPSPIRAEYEPGIDSLLRHDGGAVLGPLSLIQLTDRTCRWPIAGNGAATRFCGYCIPIGKIYCEAHRAQSRDSKLKGKT
jgi:hypothetical protein